MYVSVHLDLSSRIRDPENQAELPDVVAVMTTMETNYFHSWGHIDARPYSVVRSSPLALLNFITIRIEESNSIDVVFTFTDIDLDGGDGLSC